MPRTLADPSPSPHGFEPGHPPGESVAFGAYGLMSQLGAGPAGVRYRAAHPRTTEPVEIVVLGDPGATRWRERSKRLRAAALLRHPSARKILELRLDEAPPFLVQESVEPYSAPATRREALSAAAHLAAGIAEAHRLGLAHEGLEPRAIEAGRGGPKIDWSGLEPDTGTDRGHDADFLAPERRRGGGPSGAADVYSLGVLLSRWVGAEPGDSPVRALVASFCADEPFERPSAARAAHRLAELAADRTLDDGAGHTAVDVGATMPSAEALSVPAFDDNGPAPAVGERLGRFHLREKLGEGGMGTVYRAEDVVDGTVVALKVLRDSWARRPEALVRLFKEARLLAEANNPFVANLIEVSEDGGVYYLALEYIAGMSLGSWLSDRGPLDEPIALSIVADVARGLAIAHERGIIHRDIKPDNILLADRGESTGPPRVKLSDFGLARHIEETESLNVTRAGAIIGTPLYMAPEQSAGTGTLGPAADVYALGAVLFRLLTGRPPFEASTVLGLIAKHQREAPPPLKGLNEAVSDAAAQVVSKALAKRPEDRYSDAGALLQDLERLLRGEPTGIGVHPRLPECDPRDLIQFDFQWELQASPRQLWPHVSNTERLNRALGMPAVAFTTEFDPEEGTKRFGQFRTSGIPIGWREHPYEWVEGRRMGVLREFHQGPFQWFVSQVELIPRADGGTTLTHGIRVAARGLLGRTLAHVKLGKQGRRSMDQVYRRIDAALTGKLGDESLADPFEGPIALSDRRRRRLDLWLETLGRRGIDPLTVERIGDFLALAPAQEVARIRPLALARRLRLNPDQVAAACLLGAKEGALIMLWDLLCPVCRIPSQVVDTLRALREHGHCEACHLDYELDFAHSVELIFRAHPEVRETELGTFCIGGPAHSPHVVAQIRVGPEERVAVDLALGEGTYRIRGPQLPFSWDFRADPTAPLKHWELSLGSGPGPGAPRALRSEEQHLALHNETDRELVVRVERTAPRDDAFTAARASALALFRELFPGEVLAPGQVVNLATVTLLVTEPARAGGIYEELGDSRAFALVHEHFRRIEACVRQHGGTLIKTIQEGSVSVFNDPVAAVQAALSLARTEGHETGDLRLRIGIHRGPAMVATLNDHLDYFGAVVSTALGLPSFAPDGGLVVTRAVAADTGVAAVLRDLGLVPTIVPAALPGLAEDFVHRVG